MGFVGPGAKKESSRLHIMASVAGGVTVLRLSLCFFSACLLFGVSFLFNQIYRWKNQSKKLASPKETCGLFISLVVLVWELLTESRMLQR